MKSGFTQKRVEPSEVKTLQDKFNSLNKTIFKKDLYETRLVKLEKLVLRGESFEKSNYSPKTFLKKDSTFMTSADHKLNPSGINILRLPKLPFGSHNNYNDEAKFDHFVEDSSYNSVSYNKKRKEIAKFKRIPRNWRKNKLKSLSDYETFATKSGRLVCKKQTHITNAYDEISHSFKKIHQTFRNLSNNKEIFKRPKQVPDLNRLYTKKVSKYNSTESLIAKYPVLFS